MSVMARMSGWYNIFFCIQDIPIHEGLIEKLMQNNYRNHLAHIYIYAYDNRPEMVARAYRSEASLLYFSKGDFYLSVHVWHRIFDDSVSEPCENSFKPSGRITSR